VLPESFLHIGVPTLEHDVHSVTPFRSIRPAAPARPTWSSSPHSPAEGFAAVVPLVPFSRSGERRIPR
jgi:hypothetical protein